MRDNEEPPFNRDDGTSLCASHGSHESKIRSAEQLPNARLAEKEAEPLNFSEEVLDWIDEEDYSVVPFSRD